MKNRYKNNEIKEWFTNIEFEFRLTTTKCYVNKKSYNVIESISFFALNVEHMPSIEQDAFLKCILMQK